MLRMRRWIPVVILALTAGALVGCPQPEYDLTYYNISSEDIPLKEANYRHEGSAHWGPNRIPEGTPFVGPGEAVTIGIREGVYDLRALMGTPGGASGRAVQFSVPISDVAWIWYLEANAYTVLDQEVIFVRDSLVMAPEE